MQPDFVLVDENFKKPPQKKIRCSIADWKRMDKEDALKKDCAERKKIPLGKNSKYVWLGINNTDKISENYFSFTPFKKRKTESC